MSGFCQETHHGSTSDDNDDNNHTTSGNYEYPGLNVDWNLAGDNQHIDTDFSGEPFITYYFDSIQYGDDFNHNGIIDERENDTAIDLPYEQDSAGKHFFFKLRPFARTMMTYGHYDIEQEYRGGRNLTDYFKIEAILFIRNSIDSPSLNPIILSKLIRKDLRNVSYSTYIIQGEITVLARPNNDHNKISNMIHTFIHLHLYCKRRW